MDHTYGKYSKIVLQRLKLLPVGGRMKDLPKNLWHKSFIREGEKKTGGPNLRLLRLDPNKTSNTITAFVFNKFVHPSEDRYITPREAARLQGFPDHFIFCGAVTHIQQQIGNAVPVQLASAVAEWVTQYLYRNTGIEKANAISLFAGAGGMDLGFESHVNVVSSNEYDPIYCETLRTNFKDVVVIEGDISSLSGITLSLRKKIQLIFGGPPCQAFSAAGKQKGINDPRGKMIKEYIRIVEEVKPEIFVLENVPGLKGINSGKTLKHTLDLIDDAGYFSEWYILNSAHYGSPQQRHRLFIFGRKKKYKNIIGMPPASHSDKADLFGLKPFATVGEALKNLPRATVREGKQ